MRVVRQSNSTSVEHKELESDEMKKKKCSHVTGDEVAEFSIYGSTRPISRDHAKASWPYIPGRRFEARRKKMADLFVRAERVCVCRHRTS